MNLPFLSDPAVQVGAMMLVVTALLDFLIRRIAKRLAAETKSPHLRRWSWVLALAAPVNLLVWYYGLYAIVRLLSEYSLPPQYAQLERWIENLAGAGAFFAIVWMLRRMTVAIDAQLRAMSASRENDRLDGILLPLTGVALRVLVPIIALFFLVRLWPFDAETIQLLRKLIGVAVILAIAWIVRQGSQLAEQAILNRKNVSALNNYEGRALLTRVSVLRKIILFFVTGFALAAVLMLFDEVRDVGRSIFASAGVAGVVIGFAAQKSLGGLLAGLQIALTQPVRIGDQVMINDLVGFVEEITLTYVVVRVWDQRRLILPITYLIENPVVNYTRVSSEMMAPVAIRVDFTLPVQALRESMKKVVEPSPLWDQKTFSVQVTDAKHESMEVRILVGATSVATSFDLQCLVREKAIDFIHLNYPQCLPKAREEGKPIQGWKTSEEFGSRALDAAGIPLALGQTKAA